MDRLDSQKALSKLGGDLHFFLQRCVYLTDHPEVPPPVGAGFRWDSHGVEVFTARERPSSCSCSSRGNPPRARVEST